MDYSKYNNNLLTSNKWIDSLKDVIGSALYSGTRVVIIAIARKMARLLKYYVLQNPDLKALLRDNSNVYVITEHAIPFFLKDAIAETTEVIILDDLIVFGDTVETVYENVFSFTGIKAKIIAMAASNRFRMSLLKKNVVYPKLSDESCPDILPRELIPAFTARNSWDIVSLCHPIDLEHTILRIKIKSEDEKSLAERLKNRLDQAFPDAAVYIVSHRIPKTDNHTFSVSLVFPSEDAEVINSDFSKLRFFISEDEIRIVSYAPNIWESPLLEDDSIQIFNTPGLSDVWLLVVDSLKSALSGYSRGDEDDIDSMFLEQDFKDRVELSAVVMANYLVSFDSLCLKKERIETVLADVLGERPSFEIADEDIDLITGKYLSKEIIPMLRNAFANAVSKVTVIDRTTLRPELLRKPLVPMFPESKYKEERILDIFTQVNINSALSLVFNRLSVEFGLVDKRREDRVKVGESFDSLENSMSLHFKKDKVNTAIHEWIDSRIDLGIVVPKYEYFIGPLGYKVWRRYFRAGEREDLLKNIARAAVILADDIFGKDRKFSAKEFVSEIVPHLKRLNDMLEGQLDFDQFSRGLFLSDGYNAEFNLWVYLVRLGAIKVSSDSGIGAGSLRADADGNVMFKSTALY